MNNSEILPRIFDRMALVMHAVSYDLPFIFFCVVICTNGLFC